jgi:serine/tyrosine/threonine adenylyltransferase
LTDEDIDLFSDVLGMLEETACDFNHFFYRLSNALIFNLQSKDDFKRAAEHILPAETESKQSGVQKMADWLETSYRPRLEKEDNTNDMDRQQRMREVNPKFVLRQWILEEIIKSTQSEKGVGVKDKEMLDMVLRMALEPFQEEWGGDRAQEERLCGDAPKIDRGFQCSCSS